MHIQSGSEINPFDMDAFNELNAERFSGALTAVLQSDGSAVITTPPGMSDKDLTDAVHLIDCPLLH